MAAIGAGVMFLLARLVMHLAGAHWGAMVAGEASDNRAGNAAGALIAVVAVIFVLVPWVVVNLVLAMLSMGERLNPRLVYCLAIGGGMGTVWMLGLHPVWMLVGVICGLFAGLMRAWLAVR